MANNLETLQDIIVTYEKDVNTFIRTDDMSEDLYDALYTYYFLKGVMPYGVAKARDGDPYQWVGDEFYVDVKDYVDVLV